ncbi:hypothetical protein G7Y79_00031g065400 [Physcia stellaris]|nr:hypothetical protein G7Y79_00031g065400 [Physcia stellaris]
MPPPRPLPTHLYKILSTPPPSPLPRHLPLSPLDASDGFIHLSTASQTPRTAERFFAAADALWVLKIPLARIEGMTKWEEGRSGTYAHISGDMVGREEVVDVKEFRKGTGSDWESVFGGDDWLS